MADDQVNLPQRLRIFDRAVWRKWNKYAISGLLTILIGFVITMIGLALARQAYSLEALLVGLGIILLLVGVIRLLIGFINPSAPSDLAPQQAQEPQDEQLQDVLFQEPPSEKGI